MADIEATDEVSKGPRSSDERGSITAERFLQKTARSWLRGRGLGRERGATSVRRPFVNYATGWERRAPDLHQFAHKKAVFHKLVGEKNIQKSSCKAVQKAFPRPSSMINMVADIERNVKISRSRKGSGEIQRVEAFVKRGITNG